MPACTKARTRAGHSRRRRRRVRRPRRLSLLIALLLVLAGGLAAQQLCFSPGRQAEKRVQRLAEATVPENVLQLPLEIGRARSGQALADFTGVVIHYVGNPGTSARNNRNYFAQPTTEVCSHFVVGLEGEVIQCVPLGERSAASNSRNRDTISIEVCHPDETGKFNEATYEALVELTAWLCRTGHLRAQEVIRHYDVTGKLCPLYYVEHEEAWQQLLADIAARI